MQKLTLSSFLTLSVAASLGHAGGSQVGNAGSAGRIDILNVLAERPCSEDILCAKTQDSTMQNAVKVSREDVRKIWTETLGKKNSLEYVSVVGSVKHIGLIFSSGYGKPQQLQLFDRVTLKSVRTVVFPEIQNPGGSFPNNRDSFYLVDNDNTLLVDSMSNYSYAGGRIISFDLNTRKVTMVDDYQIKSLVGDLIYAEFNDGRSGSGNALVSFDTKLKNKTDLKVEGTTRLFPEAGVLSGNPSISLASGQVLLKSDSRAFIGSEDGKSLFVTVEGRDQKSRLYSARVEDVSADVKKVNAVIDGHSLSFNEKTCAFEGDVEQSARANKILKSVASGTLSNLQLKEYGILMKSQFLKAFPNISSYLRLMTSLDITTSGTFGSMVDGESISYSPRGENLTCLRAITKDREVTGFEPMGNNMLMKELRTALPIVNTMSPALQERYFKEMWESEMGISYGDEGRDSTMKKALGLYSEALTGNNKKLKVFTSDAWDTGVWIYTNQEIVGLERGGSFLLVPVMSQDEFSELLEKASGKIIPTVVFQKTVTLPTTRGQLVIELKYMSNGTVKSHSSLK